VKKYKKPLDDIDAVPVDDEIDPHDFSLARSITRHPAFTAGPTLSNINVPSSLT